MRLLFALTLAAAGSGQQSNLTNLAALVVAAGTAVAGGAAYLKLRQDRPKVVAEIAGIAESNLREELKTSWAAVDRLRERETELETEVGTCHRRIRELEDERTALTDRVAKLERIVSG